MENQQIDSFVKMMQGFITGVQMLNPEISITDEQYRLYDIVLTQAAYSYSTARSKSSGSV